MFSPDPSENYEEDCLVDKGGNVKFCFECKNLMIPKEDKDNKRLIYVCRNCPAYLDTTEVAENMCVYSDNVSHDAFDLKHVPSEVIYDPTMGRTNNHECPGCHQRDVVFFQGTGTAGEKSMRLYFVCVRCKEKFSAGTSTFNAKKTG